MRLKLPESQLHCSGSYRKKQTNKLPARSFHPLFCSSLSIAAVNIMLTSFIVGSKESNSPPPFCFFCYFNYCWFGGQGEVSLCGNGAFPSAQLGVVIDHLTSSSNLEATCFLPVTALSLFVQTHFSSFAFGQCKTLLTGLTSQKMLYLILTS